MANDDWYVEMGALIKRRTHAETQIRSWKQKLASIEAEILEKRGTGNSETATVTATEGE